MTGAGNGVPAPPPPVFLERQSYRRRRLMDAARLLPLLGALLFAVPLLWPAPKGAVVAEAGTMADGPGAVTMSEAMVYVFGVWAVLIALCALFGIGARYWGQNDGPPGPGQG